MIQLHLPAPKGYAGHRLVIAELDLEVEPLAEVASKPASGIELIRQKIAMFPPGEPFSALDFEGCMWVNRTLRQLALKGKEIRIRPERMPVPGGGTPMLVYERVGQ